jgi:WD40 repeat protein
MAGQIDHVAFSGDGKTLLTMGGPVSDAEVRLWDGTTILPDTLTFRHPFPVEAVAFSPDGKWILTASRDSAAFFSGGPGEARLWHAASGEPVGDPLPLGQTFGRAVFCAGGRRVVTNVSGTFGDKGQLWDVETGKPVGQEADTVSPDGRTAVTCRADGGRRLRDTLTGKPIGAPLPRSSTPAFSPDGRVLLTYGHLDPPEDAVLEMRLWDTTTGEPIGQPLRRKGLYHLAVYSPDNRILLTSFLAQNVAQLWDVAAGRPIAEPLQHQGVVDTLVFSPDGKRVLTASHNDRTARLWDAIRGEPIGRPLQHEGGVTAAAFNPAGDRVVTATAGRVLHWDGLTGEPIGVALPHPGELASVSFSPDGRTLLARGGSTAQLWDVVTGYPLGLPFIHPRIITAAAFSPDGKAVLTGSEDRTAQLWQVPSPLGGKVEQIALWTQVLTGTALDDKGLVQRLDAATWREKRRRLEQFGDPPAR